MALRKSDRDAAVLFFAIILLVTILFPLLGQKESNTNTHPDGYFTHKGKAPATYLNAFRLRLNTSCPAPAKQSLFPFDPNTADSTQLLRLGLKPWQVRTIYKYRAKGGRYRQKEDFAMLYGLTLEHYRLLEPYIRIKPEVMARDVIVRRTNGNGTRSVEPQAKSDNGNNGKQSTVNITPPKLRPGETIDINTADTTLLKRIPGIGSYFARRIVELRTRKQAFLTPEELLVIGHFPEEAIHYMTASQTFDKIHVNRLTLGQLKAHPLINHTQANDILRYRRLNGDIRSAADIAALPSFTQEHLARLTPYLLFD